MLFIECNLGLFRLDDGLGFLGIMFGDKMVKAFFQGRIIGLNPNWTVAAGNSLAG